MLDKFVNSFPRIKRSSIAETMSVGLLDEIFENRPPETREHDGFSGLIEISRLRASRC